MNASHLSRRSLAGLLLSAAVIPMATPIWAQERPSVAVDSYPLAYFAQRLVGDTADVLFDVPDGIDPSFWRPGISDISAMQSAQVIALNGAGFADWITKVSLPRSRIVDTSVGFSDQYIATGTVTHSHGEAGAHSHTGTANYFWLDFALASRQAEALAAGLIRRLPNTGETIETSLDALTNDLAVLDASSREISGLAAGQTAIASHPRYQYFARAYGLETTAMEWDASDGVTDAQWGDLEAKIAETGATLFIWEAAPATAARDRVRELGLVDVVFPPLANRPTAGDFVSGMTASVERIKQALSE